MGRLTTHVLDTAIGRPAAGMRIDFWSIDADNNRHLLKTVETNADGRTARHCCRAISSSPDDTNLCFSSAIISAEWAWPAPIRRS